MVPERGGEVAWVTLRTPQLLTAFFQAHHEVCPKFPLTCDGCGKKKISREKVSRLPASGRLRGHGGRVWGGGCPVLSNRLWAALCCASHNGSDLAWEKSHAPEIPAAALPHPCAHADLSPEPCGTGSRRERAMGSYGQFSSDFCLVPCSWLLLRRPGVLARPAAASTVRGRPCFWGDAHTGPCSVVLGGKLSAERPSACASEPEVVLYNQSRLRVL